MRLALLSSALPPYPDAIGDYTAALAVKLARNNDVTLLHGKHIPPPSPLDAISQVEAFDISRPATMHGIVEHVKQIKPDWLILQYNPFCFGKRGLNLQLPAAVRAM